MNVFLSNVCLFVSHNLHASETISLLWTLFLLTGCSHCGSVFALTQGVRWYLLPGKASKYSVSKAALEEK